jgi:hypothetical protein
MRRADAVDAVDAGARTTDQPLRRVGGRVGRWHPAMGNVGGLEPRATRQLCSPGQRSIAMKFVAVVPDAGSQPFPHARFQHDAPLGRAATA